MTREDIHTELKVMADELASHVTDQNDGYDDAAPNVAKYLEREKRLTAILMLFDRYGAESEDDLRMVPQYRADSLLWRSMHSMQGAARRWEERRARGLSNAELMDAFNHEAGNGYHGSSSDHGLSECRPGSFSYSCVKEGEPRATAKGSALVGWVRNLLKVPMPEGEHAVAIEQLTLF